MGFEPTLEGFANLCLATWLPHRGSYTLSCTPRFVNAKDAARAVRQSTPWTSALWYSSRMHVLVTGASGFLGSHIVEHLIASGHTARCLVRKSSNTKFLNTLSGVELTYGDINDEK